MKKKHDYNEWILFAESNWAIAKRGKTSGKILYETLCFHCQQAAEMAIKAVFVFNKIDFPYSHDLELLLKLLEQNNIEIPKLIFDSKSLSDYAANMRYPDDEYELDVKDFKEALKLSESVLKWAKSIIQKDSTKLF